MSLPAIPYALPEKIAPGLMRVLAYWESLRRAENNMPFWDDVNLSSLPDLADSLMLIDAFVKPERFRLRTLGRELTDRYGETVSGKFIDEIAAKYPLQYLLSQCSATVEGRTPTFYQHVPNEAKKTRISERYSRLLLPLWGNGHIGMLLGAVALD